nr:MAG TPA: hypothetical protein [Caudoviricetes sp.]
MFSNPFLLQFLKIMSRNVIQLELCFNYKIFI